MSQVNKTTNDKLLIDVGSTYFKLSTTKGVEQHFRDFNKDIYDDLTYSVVKQLIIIKKKMYLFVHLQTVD